MNTIFIKDPEYVQEHYLPQLSFTTSFPSGMGYGFGGAPITKLEDIPDASNPGDIVFFGIDSEINRRYGISNQGTAAFVREKTFSMMPWTQSCATKCHDIGILETEEHDDLYLAIKSISRYISNLGRIPALIACDHTAGMANALGVAHTLKNPVSYLYFDAHYDLGLHSGNTDLNNGNFVNHMLQTGRLDKIINIGGRCWSNYVPVYHDVPGFIWIPGGADHRNTGAISNNLALFEGATLYVSIDADVLDPSCAPNVSCPEPFGFTAIELFSACEWIGKHCRVIGADLCEIVPAKQTMESERALMRCLHALFPKNGTAGKSTPA